jgi:alpha-L-rhamnosidase
MPNDTRVRLRVGDRGRPAFLASGTPALSWQVDTDDPVWRQVAASIEIERGSESSSHRLDSAESQHLAWPGAPLGAYAQARVRVVLLAASGEWSDPSPWVTVETGPLGAEDWDASMIAATTEPADDRGTARFRRVVRVRPGLRRAVLSLTSRGVHDARIDGFEVDDVVLAPGWTDYERRLLLRSVDVTAQLTEGEHVLSATVAEGWYRERFGFDGNFAVAYPGPIAFAAQLRLEFGDGAVETVVTDGDWSATTTGPVVSASIYQGEHVDARLGDRADSDPAVPLPDAVPARILAFDPAVLAPSAAPPIRRIERVVVQEVLRTPSGGTVLDFGQNLVGWLELELDAPAGTEVVLRHAEVLEHGELGTRPLRYAAATDRYVAAGGPTTWSPRFTFHGFRYAEVTGVDLDPAKVTAVVVHSDLVRTGTLETDAPLLNRLHENVVWGMRGNFVGIPSDCPQRDERLGWTGDIQVFAPTASYLFDVTGFLGSWLTDLALQQSPSGAVPLVVPSPLAEEPPLAAAWGDAATLVPDTLHERFGDAAILEQQYASMRSWVEAVRDRAGDDLLWTGDFQFGDWLDPSAPPHNPAAAKTDGDLVATAYFFRSTTRLAAAARVLGRTDDAERYEALAAAVGVAFRNAYVTPDGRVLSDAHTAYALVIAFGLVSGEQRAAAGRRLAELVRAHGYRVRTGFVGTPLITDALTATGHVETAYRLLTEQGNPSWLYPVTMGATTIWERWDSMLPDGSINPGEMTSFNHYALGAVADWMERTIGGIAPAEPGYRAVRIEPVPGGGVSRASAALDTGFGRVATSWRTDADGFSLSVELPVGVTATVVLPDATRHEGVSHGRHLYRSALPAAEPAAPLTMDSSLASFVDDPEARAALEALFARTGYFIGLGWSDSGRWRSDAVLRNSLVMMTAAQREELDAVLSSLAPR